MMLRRPLRVLVLAVIAAGTAFLVARADEDPPLFIRGDANLDRRTTLADVFTILRYLWLGGNLNCKSAADVDDDGEIGQSDALYLLGALFYRHSAPPAPFAKPGVDPTPDEGLGCRQGLSDAGGGIAEQGEESTGSDFPGGAAVCQDDGHGADLDFIHFRGPILVMPGDARVRVPIAMELPFGALEGFTLSVQASPAIHLHTFDLAGTVLGDFDPQWVHVYKGQVDSGYLAVSIAMSISPPFRTLPKLYGETVAYLEFSLDASATVGSRLEVRFASTPGKNGLPPIRNEISREGKTQGYMSCGLVVNVVSGEDVFIRGDVNRDRFVNITDVVGILRTLFTQSEPDAALSCLDAADVDDSGDVSLTDAIHLARYLFGLAPVPRAPFPESGRDTTPDGLGCSAGS
jgi:hypothetical protein